MTAFLPKALLVLMLASPALAQYTPDSGSTLDAAQRAAIIEAISVDLDEVYIFPEVAQKMIDHLAQRRDEGAYDNHKGVDAFAMALTSDLQSISHDLHLSVRALPPGEVNAEHEVDMEEIQSRYLAAARRSNYGFNKIEIMSGNVGYLDLRQFADASIGGATAISAMNFLAGTDAIIIDLRANGGGSPSMIQLISSYFFEEPTHLNSFYVRRSDSTRQFWTHAQVSGPRMTETPLYVLTSGRTFSAAEEFSYNMRHLERGMLVGETTGGGAHPVDMVRYPEHGLGMSLPFGRAVNPVTGTNWEGTGVQPHIDVPAADALDVAYTKALETIQKNASDEAQKGAIAWALEGLKAEPQKLSADEMAAFAGEFGPRKIRVADGRLVYQRDEGPIYELVPVGDDRFHLKDLDYFRIQFQRDSAGQVITLVGRYDNGRRDENPRNSS